MIAIVTLCCFNGLAQVNQFANPLDVSIADPHVMKVGATYYLYGTANHGLGFPVYTSTDLVHWTYRGLCWTKTETSWAQLDLRAPEVIQVGGTYYLYYTGRGPENRRNICVASASSPLGPFADVKTPLLPTTMEYGSGSPFRDPVSDRYYLYVVRESSPKAMFGVELTATPTTTSGSLVQLFATTQSWEGTNLEAPIALYHNGYYYLAYSGKTNGSPDYAVGYATAGAPLGAFIKAGANPILKKTTAVSGPGHPAFATSPSGSELFLLYHTNLKAVGGAERQLAMDQVEFTSTPTGPDLMALVADGPTTDLQPIPAGAVARLEGTTDGFGAAPDRQRWNVFEENSGNWSVSGGRLSITAQDGDIRYERNDAKNIFLQYAPAGNFDVQTEVNFSPLIANEQAFLIVWQDQSNYVRLGTTYIGGPQFEVGSEKFGLYGGHIVNNGFGSAVRLKLERRGDEVTPYVGTAINGEWTKISSPTPIVMQQPQVGVGAISPGSAAGRVASFDHLTITPTAGVDEWALY